MIRNNIIMEPHLVNTHPYLSWFLFLYQKANETTATSAIREAESIKAGEPGSVMLEPKIVDKTTPKNVPIILRPDNSGKESLLRPDISSLHLLVKNRMCAGEKKCKADACHDAGRFLLTWGISPTGCPPCLNRKIYPSNKGWQALSSAL